MAEAKMKLDEARFHADRLTAMGAAGAAELDMVARARCRADMGWEVRHCREVIDIVHSAAGAQAIHRREPLQRIVRDMQAISVHSFFLAGTNAELYGRVLCGLDPGVPFL
jgi:alkylation response protein AidB-like acyl-CoA dehydrogenase